MLMDRTLHELLHICIFVPSFYTKYHQTHAYGPYLKAHCLFIYAKGWNKIVYISIPLCYILHFVAVHFPVFLVDITKEDTPFK